MEKYTFTLIILSLLSCSSIYLPCFQFPQVCSVGYMIRELRIPDSCCYGDQVSEMFLFCSFPSLSCIPVFLANLKIFSLLFNLYEKMY